MMQNILKMAVVMVEIVFYFIGTTIPTPKSGKTKVGNYKSLFLSNQKDFFYLYGKVISPGDVI